MPNIEKELKSDLKPKTKVESTTKSVTQEIRYQYLILSPTPQREAWELILLVNPRKSGYLQ